MNLRFLKNGRYSKYIWKQKGKIMYTSYAANAYTSHDLNISMKTSSGDYIQLDFSNQKSASLSHEESSNSTQDSLSFSSMQSFQFSIDSNGLDEQDKKEIAAFMKIAQPHIDNFLQELDQDAPKTPVNKLAKQVAGLFASFNESPQNTKDYIKTNLVDAINNSMQKTDNTDKVFKDAQTLLEKTLKELDELNKSLYA